MTKKSLSIKALPAEVSTLFTTLGKNICVARKSRRLKQSEMSERIFVSLPTYRRVESGDPKVSMGIYLSALYVLDLMKGLDQIACPETDEVGRYLAQQQLPKRIRQPMTDENDYDF